VRSLTKLQHAIDVEAAISDGKLSIGVFSPDKMMGLQDAEKLMEDIGTALEALVPSFG